MAVVISLLILPSEAGATQTTEYLVPTGSKVIIDKFTGTNTSALSAQLSINLIPLGGTAGNENLIVKERNLAAGETYTFPEIVGQVLEAGGVISTIASIASVITITASGRVISS